MVMIVRKAGVFGRCVDWGISNACTTRLLDVNSFQTYFPVRGWKLFGKIHPPGKDVVDFPNLLPREGMETL